MSAATRSARPGSGRAWGVGKLAVFNGLATADQIAASRRLRRRLARIGYPAPLARLLVEAGTIDLAAARSLIRAKARLRGREIEPGDEGLELVKLTAAENSALLETVGDRELLDRCRRIRSRLRRAGIAKELGEILIEIGAVEAGDVLGRRTRARMRLRSRPSGPRPTAPQRVRPLAAGPDLRNAYRELLEVGAASDPVRLLSGRPARGLARGPLVAAGLAIGVLLAWATVLGVQPRPLAAETAAAVPPAGASAAVLALATPADRPPRPDPVERPEPTEAARIESIAGQLPLAGPIAARSVPAGPEATSIVLRARCRLPAGTRVRAELRSGRPDPIDARILEVADDGTVSGSFGPYANRLPEDLLAPSPFPWAPRGRYSIRLTHVTDAGEAIEIEIETTLDRPDAADRAAERMVDDRLSALVAFLAGGRPRLAEAADSPAALSARASAWGEDLDRVDAALRRLVGNLLVVPRPESVRLLGSLLDEAAALVALCRSPNPDAARIAEAEARWTARARVLASLLE